ncbi:MAG: S8 family serine peptidase [Rubrivivax sp.]|nr:S8 family serine peptidase [Rubrivivax sp.]
MSGLALAAALALLGAGPAAAQAAGAAQAEYAQGRILVMPRAGLPDAALARILNDNGKGKGRRVGKSNLHIVDLPPGLEKQSIEKLARHPHIEFAELDMRVPESLAANDPYVGSQWHLPKIGASQAWDVAQGSGVTIAILDSGIDTKHPDFSGRLVPGYNFVDKNTNIEDVRSHGTKVAGAAAATLNNALGVASVAGQAKIMPVRISDSTGYTYWSNMAAGLTWAADNGARIANMSFNGVAGSSSVLSAAKYMKDRGGLSFVSAGNDNKDPGYANTDVMIIVSATDSNDAKSSFSNFGDHVHLSAPGSGIYSTTWGQTYASVSGTSFSAPVAAAVAALVMSANPKLTNTQVEQILFKTAVDLGAAGRDIYFGYGRVDAAKAVAMALSTVSTADTTAPTVSVSNPLASSTVSGLVPVNANASDNVGVTKVELRVNGQLVATDSASPFAFSWDSTAVANGMASVVATAYDAAGNSTTSSTVSVNVANATVTSTDSTPPVVKITNPLNGTKVSGNVKVMVSASDNAGTSGIRQVLYMNGKSVATSNGGTLNFGWNASKAAVGSYTFKAVATDAAGNASSTSVTVTR